MAEKAETAHNYLYTKRLFTDEELANMSNKELIAEYRKAKPQPTKKQKIARLKWAIKRETNEYEQDLLMQELFELKESEA